MKISHLMKVTADIKDQLTILDIKYVCKIKEIMHNLWLSHSTHIEMRSGNLTYNSEKQDYIDFLKYERIPSYYYDW